MTSPPTTSHTLSNGLTVLVQQMPAVQSAAYSLLVPAGSLYDREGRSGTASVVCDMLTRGAGTRDSRQLAADQDFLGLQRSESVNVKHMKFSGATLRDHLGDSLEILADIVRRPHLNETQFPAAVSSVRQTLLSNEDEPRQKVIIELNRRCLGLPWGLPTDGSLDDIDAVTIDDVRGFYESCFRPEESILGVAGNIDEPVLVAQLERLFGDWETGAEPETQHRPPGPPRDHLQHDSQQTHIGLAFPSVSVNDPEYYEAWAAVSVLSGGSSARLFTEVREKRGLCYAVHASLSALKDRGHVLCYAGTTNERAQETLDVMLQEIDRLAEGITDEELKRCQAGAKSALIMQQESSTARAARIARDWYLRGAIVTLEEIHDKLDALTPDAIADFVRRHPADDITLLTVGPQPLEIARAVS